MIPIWLPRTEAKHVFCMHVHLWYMQSGTLKNPVVTSYIPKLYVHAKDMRCHGCNNKATAACIRRICVQLGCSQHGNTWKGFRWQLCPANQLSEWTAPDMSKNGFESKFCLLKMSWEKGKPCFILMTTPHWVLTFKVAPPLSDLSHTIWAFQHFNPWRASRPFPGLSGMSFRGMLRFPLALQRKIRFRIKNDCRTCSKTDGHELLNS